MLDVPVSFTAKIQPVDIRNAFVQENTNMKNSSHIVKFVKVSDWRLISDIENKKEINIKIRNIY